MNRSAFLLTLASLALPALADDLSVTGVDKDRKKAIYAANEMAVKGANQSGHCIAQWADDKSCQQHQATGLWQCKAAIAGAKPEQPCEDHNDKLENYKINFM